MSRMKFYAIITKKIQNKPIKQKGFEFNHIGQYKNGIIWFYDDKDQIIQYISSCKKCYELMILEIKKQ